MKTSYISHVLLLELKFVLRDRSMLGNLLKSGPSCVKHTILESEHGGYECVMSLPYLNNKDRHVHFVEKLKEDCDRRSEREVIKVMF